MKSHFSKIFTAFVFSFAVFSFLNCPSAFASFNGIVLPALPYTHNGVDYTTGLSHYQNNGLCSYMLCEVAFTVSAVTSGDTVIRADCPAGSYSLNQTYTYTTTFAPTNEKTTYFSYQPAVSTGDPHSDYTQTSQNIMTEIGGSTIWFASNLYSPNDFNYEEWGENLWNQFYFHSPIPTDHYIVPGTNYNDPDNYIFPIAVGNSEQPIWMFHHDGLYHDAEYYEDYITLEVLDAMQGNVTYTHIVDTDLYFLDDSDNEVMIFYLPGALADTVQKHFALRFHNLADDENYCIIYFSLVGDADYWAYGDMTPYDMCETFDSTWSKAICHMIVPAPDFFSNNFAELKAEFESAFPFIFQIRTIVLASASEIRDASTDTPTMPASSEWKGMSIQLWNMSVIAPYMETLRGYMSIVLWGIFIYYLLNQVLLLLKPNE